MTSEGYRSAEHELDAALGEYRRAIAMARSEPARAMEPWYMPAAGQNLMAALVRVWTTADGALDTPNHLAARALAQLQAWSEDLRDDPRVARETARSVEALAFWVERTAQRSDEIAALASAVSTWEQRAPSLAPLPLRRAAVAAIEQALAVPLIGPFPIRMVLAGVRAFGPRLAVDLAAHYVTKRVNDYACWLLLQRVLDELAAWASATSLHGTPQEFQVRAIPALISIAGHPDLTEQAIRRIPVHRLDEADRRRVADLLADRAAVMPFDWISDEDQFGTASVEVAYLRALDAQEGRWPGQRAR